MKKNLILFSSLFVLTTFPTEASADTKWDTGNDIVEVGRDIEELDLLLQYRGEKINDLESRITELESEAQLSQQTKDKAQAFDVITETIRDESGIDIHTGNYQSTLTRLTELYHNNGFVRTAARTIIEWLF